MLPATNSPRPSLAEVLPSCLKSILRTPDSLRLPPVDKAVVLLADGLGAAALRARAGHSRVLAPALSKATTISAGFPTTTAAALATLTTGEQPGVHGLVGYTVLDAAHDRVVNQLNGWDALMEPAVWQRSRTVFERGQEAGIPSFAIGIERYRDSGFTQAVLRGAEYRSGASIEDRLDTARAVLDTIDRGILYVYVPELDQSAHSHGWESPKWTGILETLDSVVGAFVASLGRREGLLVTADHGVLDIPAHAHVLFGEDPALVDGIRFVAGEPRCLQLHFEPDASESHRESLLERWRAAEGERAWVLTRTEAIDAGWFGPTVDAEVRPRIGDILVAARKGVAYYDTRAPVQKGRDMIGQHGSWSPEETNIPLLRFGAYAR